MKIKLLQPMNLEGRDYRKDDEVQMNPQDAKVLVRAGYAVMVAERAVNRPAVEIRSI